MNSVTDKSMANAFEPGKVELSAHMQSLVDRRVKVLGPAYRLMYDSPLYFVRGEGVWLFSEDGKKYLDVYNNVASLGHAHPKVAAAIAKQVFTLATNTRYLHESILEYAERLLATFPRELGNMMFTCTGSEANDLAYRIAKTYTGGSGIIVTESAYHGISDAVSQFSPSLGPNVPLGAHVFKVPAPNSYRYGQQVSIRFIHHVQDALDRMKHQGIRPAALILDSMFTSDGVFGQPPTFLRKAAEAVRAQGGIYIADEVQSGFARTGSHMWGFQRHDVVPDIVTMGKPMGSRATPAHSTA